MSDAANAERALELADAAFGQHDVEKVVTHLSTAIRGFTAADDKRRAAMACVRLGDVLANAMGNLTASRAWFTRAWRLVEHEPPCLEQGWVAIAAMGCDVDDPAVLLAAAELALDRARQFGEINLETKALADAGLAHVQAGRLEQGMTLLDEAMALACGPADDTDTTARSVCSFFTACYYAADFERAGTWADLLRRQGLISLTPGGPVFLSSHCDSVQATLLVELGRWAEAEQLLVRAKADFETAMQVPSWHPDIALADLRVRQGRFTEAEALLLGKDQSIQALLPAARLHLGRGDPDLARAAARRGLRAMGDDRLRAVELLTLLLDAELGRGDLDAAAAVCGELAERAAEVDVPTLRARAAAAESRLLAATGELHRAVHVLEDSLDRLDANRLPWLRATLLLDLARLREASGDIPAATADARRASSTLATLDVVLAPADAALVHRLEASPHPLDGSSTTAALVRDGKWWSVTYEGSTVRLPTTKGLGYLAELVARPGVECHVLDLVDRVEGVSSTDRIDRRALGDAGEVLDAHARAAYRRRIEELRAEADLALEAGQLETAEAVQDELDQLVTQLAQAFGLGGRDRRAASAAERARVNVTRALRSAVAKICEAMPEAGAALDCGLRTGVYCTYDESAGNGPRWIVQS
jgi:tetratricopeptide (TPR) repeat protein